jgi:septum formation protein
VTGGHGGASGVRLVLASRSPQRKALLRQLGIPFRVVISDHDEDAHHGRPAHTVGENARGKAVDVLDRVRLRAGELVLGVDTVVAIDEHVLGKAADEEEAVVYLRRLAGRRHEVYSGLHLCSPERAVTAHAVTGVTFRELTAGDVARYVSCGEWRERAGAYAIQGVGSALVASVDGDYFNVVGLPVAVLLDALRALGAPPFSWL